MKQNKINNTRFPLIAIGLSVAISSTALGQTAEEKKAFDTLMRFKQLISEVINGKTNPGNKSTVFAMVMPGIGIHEKRDGSDDSSATMPAWVLNTLPSTDLTGNTASTNITEIYRKVLFATDLKDPKTLDQLQKDEAAAQVLSDQLAPFDEAYWTHAKKYMEAVDALNTALKFHGPSSSEAKKAEFDKKHALGLWTSQGKKIAREKISGDIFKLVNGGAEPWLLWRKRYEAAAGDTSSPDIDQNFGVAVYPAYKFWTENSGWTTLAFGGSHLHTYDVKKSFSGSGSAGASFLGFGARASGNYSKTHDISGSAFDSMSFSMEVKRVLIYRSWGDPLVFRSPNWKWSDAAMQKDPNSMISQGKYDATKGAFLGLMPLHPTSIILCRNVEITAKFTKEDKDYFTETISGSAKGGFFLWRAKANATKTTTSTITDKGDGFATIKIPEPQIIGYICEVLPESPAQDKTVTEADRGGLEFGDF
jgi:hypothetical protein